jgi:hypothetical protein
MIDASIGRDRTSFDSGEGNAMGPIAAALSRDDGPLLIGLPAIAGTFVFAIPLIGWWAVAVAVLVYLVGYRAFEAHRRTGAVHDELVATLEMFPEAAGQVAAGHGRRSGETAELIATALALDERSRAAVVTAARCRKVGRLGCADPAPSRNGHRGDESSVWDGPGFDQVDAARWSAAIVGTVGALAPAAALIDPEAAQDPQRRRLRAIVDLASGYDDATSGMGLDPVDAVELLRASSPPEAASALEALAVAAAPPDTPVRDTWSEPEASRLGG